MTRVLATLATIFGTIAAFLGGCLSLLVIYQGTDARIGGVLISLTLIFGGAALVGIGGVAHVIDRLDQIIARSRR